MCIYPVKIGPKSKKRVFGGYTKGMKRFKLWDPIKKKMLISKDVIFYEELMLKKEFATNVLAYEGETSLNR